MDYHSGDSLTGFFGFEGTKKGPTSLKILINNYHANSRKYEAVLLVAASLEVLSVAVHLAEVAPAVDGKSRL